MAERRTLRALYWALAGAAIDHGLRASGERRTEEARAALGTALHWMLCAIRTPADVLVPADEPTTWGLDEEARA